MPPFTESLYLAQLSMSQHSTMEETEMYTYDGNNFLADAGGFLGLLLGFSIVDLMELAKMFLAKKFGRRNKAAKSGKLAQRWSRPT